MGLPGLFKYYDKKRGLVADYGLRCVFHLLHTLVSIFRKSRLGCENIPNRRLELVRNDGSYYVLVLVELKMG